jgi:hypothetical protein
MSEMTTWQVSENGAWPTARQHDAALMLDDGREAHLWVGPYWPDRRTRYYTVAIDGLVCVEGRAPTLASAKLAATQAAHRLLSTDDHGHDPRGACRNGCAH